ncbi:MAG: DUF3577 domain-containing protein [Betaproteobacteria bacterium]|nr:DUF3577 domain-containing protein [Betaproteobacteria bacterium]
MGNRADRFFVLEIRLACHVAAPRGSDSDVRYTKFDCRLSGADAQEVVRRLEADVAAEKSVIICFRIADIYPEMFTFAKGDRKGQSGMATNRRLLRIKFAFAARTHADGVRPAAGRIQAQGHCRVVPSFVH